MITAIVAIETIYREAIETIVAIETIETIILTFHF